MRKILIANRGEIAVRVINTCKAMHIRSVAVYSTADRDALHVQLADEAVCLGAAPVEDSYLNSARIIEAAMESGAEAIHPGYGFLSENAEFARAVMASGLCWIGPPVSAMEAMASKIRSREIAISHNVPVMPALSLERSAQPELMSIAALGLPLLLKASAGGGGIGMREVHSADELENAIGETRAQAERQFGDGALLIERLVGNARHIEVQVLGDQQGKLLHLHDRDCSLQRRRQKVIEEAPAPGLSPALRESLHAAALRLAAAVDYQGVGTVEFLVEGENFYLLEMNTRLQVEHGVTEAVFGLDLVRLQIDIASGLPLQLSQEDLAPCGHAIEARIYAEDPLLQFTPATGTITGLHFPLETSLRVDQGLALNTRVGHHYDGLLCKVIAAGSDRSAASAALLSGLQDSCIAGVSTNLRFLRALLEGEAWRDAAVSTRHLEENLAHYQEQSIPTESAVECALIAATVWQFLRQPPEADRVPWPGAYCYQRESRWLHRNHTHCLQWRWESAGCFHFPNSDMHVRLDSTTTQTDSLILELNGLRRCFRFFQNTGSITVFEPAIGDLTLSPAHGPAKAGRGENPARCTSPGPGLVLKLLVNKGDQVAAGDPLVVLESMKMESTLSAGCSGVVDELCIEPGALVESGQLLIKIATQEETET
jgi:acetyl-CoA/propionyl-CoA carboxylase biotin carboxyl carrier protein